MQISCYRAVTGRQLNTTNRVSNASHSQLGQTALSLMLDGHAVTFLIMLGDGGYSRDAQRHDGARWNRASVVAHHHIDGLAINLALFGTHGDFLRRPPCSVSGCAEPLLAASDGPWRSPWRCPGQNARGLADGVDLGCAGRQWTGATSTTLGAVV